MELNATQRRVLSAVEAATSDRRAATNREIAACLTEPISRAGGSSLREVLDQLEDLKPPLVQFDVGVAEFYRPPQSPPMGDHRWHLTDAGREVLRQIR